MANRVQSIGLLKRHRGMDALDENATSGRELHPEFLNFLEHSGRRFKPLPHGHGQLIWLRWPDVSLFTASRQLSEWHRQGILAKSRGKILLRAPERLVSQHF